MDATLFARLAAKYADGFYNIDPLDFEGVDYRDRLKLMEDVRGTDIMQASLDTGGGLRAKHPKGKKPGKPELPPRAFRYTMSTQNPVGSFGDVIEVAGWNLLDFNKRGRPFLFGHNLQENRHPLGSMSNVLKGAKEDEVKGQPVLAGTARFTEEGLNPFNDLTHDMVLANAMPGGSVGFRILESRAPTEEELAANKGIKKYSFVSVKTSLVEYSAVPVGMDPDAVKRRSDSMTEIEALLVTRIAEGRYDEALVAEFRQTMLGIEPKPKGRSLVAMGDDHTGTPLTATEQAVLELTRHVILVNDGESDDDDAIENRGDGDLTEDDLTNEEAEELTRLETAIAQSLVGGDEGTEGGDHDDLTDESVRQEHADDDSDESEATPPSDLPAIVRALDRMGVPVDIAELQHALVEPEAAADSAQAEEVRALVAECVSLRTNNEHLAERLAFLEESLLPESASDDDGGEDASRTEGGDGNPEVGVHEYLDDLTDADLRSLVEST